jgi:WD40 repeat protein
MTRVIAVLGLAFLLPGLGSFSSGQEAKPAGKEKPAAEQKPRVDQYGDPLPPGAIARLGTLRLRHQDRVTSVAYSPDGKTIASGSWDGTVRLWETSTGKELHQFTWTGSSGSHRVECVALSADGSRLAAGGGGVLQVWDLATRMAILTKERLPSVTAVAFSPDGKTLASAGTLPGGEYLGAVLLWDVATGQELKRLEGHSVRVNCVAFSPDGKTLASGSGIERSGGDTSVRLWDVVTGKEVRKLEGHQKAVDCVAFSPDGNSLATGGYGALCLWNLRDGKRTLHLQEHTQAVAFSSDAKLLAHGGVQNSLLQIRDLDKGRNIRLFETPTQQIAGLAFSPDGSVVSAACGTRIRSWRLDNGQETPRLEGHGFPIACMAWSADGKTLVTGAGPDEVVLWNTQTAAELGRLDFPIGQVSDWPMGVKSLAISPSGDVLATVTGDGRVRLWDLATRKLLHEFEPDEGTRRFTHASFLDGGKTLAACRQASVIVFWDAATRKERWRLRLSENEARFGVEFIWLLVSPDEKTLAWSYVQSRLAGPALREIVGWDMNAGREVFRLRGTEDPVATGVFSPGSTRILAAGTGYNSDVAVWDLKSGQEIARLKRFNKKGDRLPVSFGRDDNTIMLAGDDSSIIVWDIGQNRTTRRVAGHAARPTSFAFSAKAGLFASGSADTTILLWKEQVLR